MHEGIEGDVMNGMGLDGEDTGDRGVYKEGEICTYILESGCSYMVDCCAAARPRRIVDACIYGHGNNTAYGWIEQNRID